MAYFNPCCCDKKQEYFGLMIQTIRKKRPEDVLVQRPTRNFFMFQEVFTGVTGTNYIDFENQEIVGLPKTGRFESLARQFGVNLFGISGGTWYDFRREGTPSPNPFEGTLVSFTGPHYLGTYSDAFLSGVCGGTFDSVLDSAWDQTLEIPPNRSPYDIFYEYDLFLPEELRGADIASIRGEYDYFDLYQTKQDLLTGLTGYRTSDSDLYKHNYNTINKYGDMEHSVTVPEQDQTWTNSGRNYLFPVGQSGRPVSLENDPIMGSNISTRTYIPIITEFYTTITNHFGTPLPAGVTGIGAVYPYRNILRKSNKSYYFPAFDETFTFENYVTGYSFHSRDGLNRAYRNDSLSVTNWPDSFYVDTTRKVEGVRGVYTPTTFKYWDYYKEIWGFGSCCSLSNLLQSCSFSGRALYLNSLLGCNTVKSSSGCVNSLSSTLNTLEQTQTVIPRVHSTTKTSYSKGVSRVNKLLNNKSVGGLSLTPKTSFTIFHNIDKSWFKNIEPLLNIQNRIEFERQDWLYHYVSECGLANGSASSFTGRLKQTPNEKYTSKVQVCLCGGESFFEIVKKPGFPDRTWDVYYSTFQIKTYIYDWRACPKAVRYKHLYMDEIEKEYRNTVPMTVVRLSPIEYIDAKTRTKKIKYFITGEYFYTTDVQQLQDNWYFNFGLLPWKRNYRNIDVCQPHKFDKFQTAEDCGCSPSQTYNVEDHFDNDIPQNSCDYDDTINEKCFQVRNSCLPEKGTGVKYNPVGNKYYDVVPAFNKIITTTLTGPTNNKKIEFWGGYNKGLNQNSFTNLELLNIPSTLFTRTIFSRLDSNYCGYNPNASVSCPCDNPGDDFISPTVSFDLFYGFSPDETVESNKPYYAYLVRWSGTPKSNPNTQITSAFSGLWDFRLSGTRLGEVGWPVINSSDHFGTDLKFGAIGVGPGSNKITKDNNIWYSVKNYAQDVYRCAIQGNCNGFNTIQVYNRSKSNGRFPQFSFFDAYPSGYTLTRNMCQRLVDFFGVTGEHLNINVFPESPLGMTTGKVYDWRMPLYASNDSDFESVFWKYAAGITKGYTFAGWTIYQL